MSKKNQIDYSQFSMHELFCTELEGQSALLIDGLLELEKSPDDAVQLEILMRAGHSIKGAARLVNIKPVESIAHVLEDCFVSAQNKTLVLDENDIDILLAAVDVIKEFISMDEPEMLSWGSKNTEILDSTVDSLKAIVSPPKSAKKSKSKKSVKPSVKPAKRSTVETRKNDESQDRVVRISADRLARLMGLSGELLITSKWTYPFLTSMLQLKKRQTELAQTIDALKESIAHLIKDDSKVESHISLAVDKANNCRKLLNDRMADIEQFDRRMTNQTARLYREVISNSMRPFADGVQGFNRMVRDIAKQTGKKVELDIQGLEKEVDRDVLEKIEAPLTHLIRNAVDHGIEFPEERIKTGKSEVGKITVSAVYSRGMLGIIVEDDGRGVDYDVLKKSIVKKGLVAQEIAETLSDQELLEFLFLPKFSTRDEVTELSGRGVGLDVVREVLQEVRGLVHVHSTKGKGTKFTLQLPITLSVVSALLVEISGESYAFPLIRVNRITSVNSSEILRMEGHQYITQHDEHLGLVSGSQVFGKQADSTAHDNIPIVVVNDHLNKYGVVVDKLIGQRELVVQALDPRIGKIKDISASAILEDGLPTLIIDVDDFVRSINTIISDKKGSKITHFVDVADKKIPKRVLVVDDSITVRGVERNLLVANGYEVVVAVDGMDGWNTVRSQDFDLIITDVDMPRMDGIELVELIKRDTKLNSLPVMIVSYKDRMEDRKRGMDAGADYYLTKGSFHDETLLEAVIDLIGEAL